MSTPTFPHAATTSKPWGRGLMWDIEKTPNFSTAEQRTVTGRRAAIANYANPLWHWKCKFSVLRDVMSLDRNSAKATAKDAGFQEVVGFLLQRRGKFEPFFWRDPTDKHVTNQTIVASAPASTTDYQIVRTFGNGTTAQTSPVGGVDPTGTITITVNGVSTSAFTINTPYDGWIRFTSAPATGALIIATALDYVHKVVIAKDGTAVHTFARDYWEILDFEVETVVP